MDRSYAIVTGGAGFIGSHLADKLMEKGWRISVVDNLSNGQVKNVERWLNNENFKFIEADLKRSADLEKTLGEADSVFHFAANPEVRIGETKPQTHFQENLYSTFNVLEAIRRGGRVETLVFASTSTVYGEADVLPTLEDYGPLFPISTYGATKLGCEALISSYAFTFGFKALILRLANIVGSRANHGVIFDFINKLRKNPTRLDILGDGTQTKSYLHVEDCVEAILHLHQHFKKNAGKVEVYNVGSDDQVNVRRIAEILVEEMGLQCVTFNFTGGVDGGRGWRGDVKKMRLDIRKLQETGWRQKYGSETAVRLAARETLRTNQANQCCQ